MKTIVEKHELLRGIINKLTLR